MKPAVGGHGEAAHVDLATGADHHTVRIEEEDIAADATVLVVAFITPSSALRSSHQVEQVRAAAGQMQVDRLATAMLLAAEG